MNYTTQNPLTLNLKELEEEITNVQNLENDYDGEGSPLYEYKHSLLKEYTERKKLYETPSEIKQSLRERWLSEYARDESDVMEDTHGEFVLIETETDHGDTYQVGYEHVYLPDALQNSYVPF